MNPYVYVVTGKSRDVYRKAPDGARVAVHYPAIGRTVELWTDANGGYTLRDLPAPGVSGEESIIARGRLS